LGQVFNDQHHYRITSESSLSRVSRTRRERPAPNAITPLLRQFGTAALHRPAPVKVDALREVGPRWLKSRIDMDEKTERRHRSALERIYAWGGDRDPHNLTFNDCQEYVGTLLTGIEELKPISHGSVRKYMDTLKMLLDFAGREPNPARDKGVKVPTVRPEEPNRRPASSSSRSSTTWLRSTCFRS
jgi:hypothetical protein